MRVNALLVAILGPVLAASGAAAQQPAGKVWTQEEMFRRNVGTREHQRRRSRRTRSSATFTTWGPEPCLVPRLHPGGSHPDQHQLRSRSPGVEGLGREARLQIRDIKIILGSHAHGDHMEGDALVKEMTGAQVMAMSEDVPALERMRPGDKPHPIDRRLRYGEEVTLGRDDARGATDARSHARLHDVDAARAGRRPLPYQVVIVGSMGSNPGFQFVNNRDNPGIADEYKRGFAVLRTLKPDVPLASHPAM